jgi:NitT/TauT family transport system permease protein
MLPTERPAWWADAIVFAGVVVILYVGARLAFGAPAVVKGRGISLSPAALPYYAALSLGRMSAAYILSLAFTLVYGYKAAFDPRARRVLLPLLDVLQSVPILSFLPVVLLGLSAVLPQALAAELAAVVLIFTSQVWNLTFAWYQALRTVPRELREAGQIFQLRGLLRATTIELPFAAIGLIWNSMMSWAGGWFFLMAAEIFTFGDRDFRLPGLGAYLSEAARAGDVSAIAYGVATLVLVIVALDQLLWRPLLARPASRSSSFAGSALRYVGLAALVYGSVRAAIMLAALPLSAWGAIAAGSVATMLRVIAALVIALAWTVPAGVAIGMNRRLARWCQPIVQIAASVPATALFPVFLLAILNMSGGMNIAAVVLMLAGTQWYLLFNVIAGATAIPQDLKYTAALLNMSRLDRWRTLILPALFPYLGTGASSSTGGAWNASIVAEYSSFGGRTVSTVGLGSLISNATAAGAYPLLLGATLTMIFIVSLINRFVWRRLYRLAEERYRME